MTAPPLWRRPFLAGVALSLLIGTAAWGETFERGDVVMVYGQFQQCVGKEFLLDHAQVDTQGFATLFSGRPDRDELALFVIDRAPQDVATILADGIERREGYRPKTLRIERLTIRDMIRNKGREALLKPRGRCTPKFQRRPGTPTPQMLPQEFGPPGKSAPPDKRDVPAVRRKFARLIQAPLERPA